MVIADTEGQLVDAVSLENFDIELQQRSAAEAEQDLWWRLRGRVTESMGRRNSDLKQPRFCCALEHSKSPVLAQTPITGHVHGASLAVAVKDWNSDVRDPVFAGILVN